MTSSFRKQDMDAEQELGKFIDNNFYRRLESNPGYKSKYKRVVERSVQLDGVDVIVESPKGKFYIDEKASIYYSNLMIPTFAFEIDSIQEGHDEPVEGWFLNDELITDYYILMWPNVKCQEKKIGDKTEFVRVPVREIKSDDFTIIEAMLIKKQTLREAVEKDGADKVKLKSIAKELRENEKDDIVVLNDNMRVMITRRLAEKPINLVIRKEYLKKLANATFLISEDGYGRIQ